MSFDIAKYPTLALVDSTQELRLLPKESLPKLCDELRRYLLDSVSRSSGHFASGLGTVELTVALHFVYNTPFDQLIWDVGHQAYPHKILTGRRDKIGTIRQKGGLHPFPWRGESEYDVLSVGHSSTSISAGIGIAVAAEKEGKNRRTVCVIGDGAITAGMAFEAMNHAGDIRPDMLVVLNDNEMSISENVGALNNHLAQLLSGKLYSSLREGGKKVFSGVPPIKELLKRTEEHIKGMVVPGTLFEELGFNYIGPVDGHDVLGLITTLKNMRDLKGPQFPLPTVVPNWLLMRWKLSRSHRTSTLICCVAGWLPHTASNARRLSRPVNASRSRPVHSTGRPSVSVQPTIAATSKPPPRGIRRLHIHAATWLDMASAFSHGLHSTSALMAV